jgi:hypothetical protein
LKPARETDAHNARLAFSGRPRAELWAADRARQTARRKAIYRELHPETQHGAVGGGQDQSRKVCDSATRFSAETAKATGRSERVVQLDAERGSRFSPYNRWSCCENGRSAPRACRQSRVNTHHATCCNRGFGGEEDNDEAVLLSTARECYRFPLRP